MLLASKTRVAPVKQLSIPRLELQAAVLLARLTVAAKKARSLAQLPTYCWTDSSVVLAWLNQHASRWKQFVANRVAEVHTLHPNIPWRHVPTDTNPADLLSRGKSVKELLESTLWWEGPQWLSQLSQRWPNDLIKEHIETDLENKSVSWVGHHVQNKFENSHCLFLRVSSWKRILRVIARVLKFTELLKYAHRRCLHGGVKLTLSTLRQSYWVLSPRAQVKTVVHHCICWAKIRAIRACKLIAELPKSRITRPPRIFTNCGIDYAGLLQVRMAGGRGHKAHPCYLAIFVYFAVKAVHLKIATDYSTTAFIAVLQRFVWRTGTYYKRLWDEFLRSSSRIATNGRANQQGSRTDGLCNQQTHRVVI
ncbi:uncharacterized protein [Cardiocondyla obscurior]|uniref:uncharacterized protein n=1 Tax=Cardiocondyla obscurior TaxID=286306 RepID=UPI0039658178